MLGVAGGIAAYKAVEVCRRLVDAGAWVSPVLTEDATRFIGALTFSALASEPARTSLFGGPEPIPHTRLGQTADLIIVSPATAKLLGKYAAGISDDLLTATLLATRAPVLVAPAMHTEMWEHAAVQENLATLRRRGVHVVDPESGRLAGGDVGEGRLADPGAHRRAPRPRCSAGAATSPGSGCWSPRAEPGRRSTRCGSSATARPGRWATPSPRSRPRRGASVTLVDHADAPGAAGRSSVVPVESAEDMHREVLGRFPDVDVVVMAAAVADFRPKAIATEKLKKRDGLPGDRARADAGHPRRARREQAVAAAGRLRGRDRAHPRARGREAGGASTWTSSSPTT